jgi:hypothetical protein
MPRDWDRSLPTRRGGKPKTATSNANLTLDDLTIRRAELQHKPIGGPLRALCRKSLHALEAFFDARMTGSSISSQGAARFWPNAIGQKPIARMRTRRPASAMARLVGDQRGPIGCRRASGELRQRLSQELLEWGPINFLISRKPDRQRKIQASASLCIEAI